MRRDLVDAEAAGVICGRGAWTVRKAVRDGRLTNHGTARAYELDPAEVAAVLGDCLGIFGD